MQSATPSAWQRLKNQEISCAEALKLLVDDRGSVNTELLDRDVNSRFLRHFPDKSSVPPVIPLLLWRGCYYLGSPVEIDSQAIAFLAERTGSNIQIIPISDNSYRTWFHTQNLNTNRITATPFVNPLTGEQEAENITETTQIYLSRSADQIERIKTLLSGALRNRASDIHLEPTTEGLRVRYRIDGVLRDITMLPQELSRRVIVAIKVMSKMDISESRRPQDGRIEEKYTIDENAEMGMDMRVSTLPCVNGEKAVIRLLPRENPFSQLENLGFSQQTLQVYKSWLQQPQGMIILTGPTGSGKTSTLYTSLQAVATENVNVVTVEDPVEYILPRITQTQVNEAAGMTFAAGLRAILRQDPDIIMVGEIRDRETAETAVRAALTGHLVFTTLHTNDAVGAIPRLRDIGPDPGLLSDALLGIVAQRLVRRVCPHCSEPYTPTEADLRVLGIDSQHAHAGQWRKGKGCGICFNSGYLGREAVVELLDVDDTVREIIYEGTLTQLHRYLREIHFASFRTAAVEKVTNGLTTVEEVLRVLPRTALYSKLVDKGVTPKLKPMNAYRNFGN
ncbi:GspE/PulE family protein [Chroococcidiopsis sp. TS-821]|uniref:GspE/PulE family protein n=1 Tax=Chroococcidiopsis sp. TS-821 TaxID=1378066 RepID=UPI000CEDD548|nr:GspE/PulE family protein [Chroococcidiopsis sp. TS-821]PPS40002.1 general secretion pathway protein GspE [Chroococcidiopsis sp. TS-821]